MDPKMNPKTDPKWTQNRPQNEPQNGPQEGPQKGPQNGPHFGSKNQGFPLVLQQKRKIRVQGRKALAYDAWNKCRSRQLAA